MDIAGPGSKELMMILNMPINRFTKNEKKVLKKLEKINN